MIGFILAGVAGVIAVPATGALFYRKVRQHRLVKALVIDSLKGIVEDTFVRIGGIQQWIGIRGQDRDNPVVLVLHGGPGACYSVFTPLLRSWEKHFTIVQWDQRGAGKTFGKNGKEGCGALSFDRLAQDGIELAEHLCERLGHQRLILVGSSVGSILGIKIAQRRPDLFHAYVGTDQNVGPDPDHVAYRMTLGALRASGNSKGVRAFQKIGPDPSRWSRKDFDRRNRWMDKSVTTVPNGTDLMLPSMMSSPDHTVRDIINIFKGMKFSLDLLYDELLAFDARKVGMRFELPFFIFQGETDWITPTVLATKYFREVQAPHKQFALIEMAGHLAALAQPDQFLNKLLTEVRPLAAASDQWSRGSRSTQ